jgi:signal transduction histidine kinase
MPKERVEQAYEEHRRLLVAPAIERVCIAGIACTIAYLVVDVAVEGLQLPDVLYYSTLLALIIGGFATVRSRRLRRPEVWVLAFDIAFTLVLASRMLVPATTLSGTGLVISLKMLAIVLIMPWSPRLHVLSVVAGVSGYVAMLALRHVAYATPVEVHQMIGPPLSGFLAAFGGTVLDRARRELFERTANLRESEVRLRALLAARDEDAAVAESLARIGSAVVGAINKPGLLDRLAEEAARVLEADFGHVLLHAAADDAYYVAAGWGDPPDMWEEIRVMRFPRAALSGVHEVLDEVGLFQTGPDFEKPILPPDVQRPYGITLAMVVQLRHEDAPLGLIAVGFRGRREPFSRQQQRVARGIARVASLGLANARLFDELERANGIKDDFVASMSHELRTPLNVILGYQELLIDGAFGPLNGEQRDTLERLQQNSVQLLDMVNAILDLSRLEADRVETALEPVDVVAFLADLRRHSVQPGSAGASTIVWAVDPGLPVLVTDPAKLRIVLKNLLANALKFGAGRPVYVSAAAIGGHLEVSVADEGIGIPVEAQAMIFEPFRQADDSIARRFGGAGLGLHIARRLVDVLGGSLVVESVPGDGATFRVTLPFVPEAPLARAVVF